jgi:4'-phosphopantetheinyl transferase
MSDNEIGVDIEKLRTAGLDIANEFFTMRECRYIASSEDQNKAFFEIWTKKEAYIKHQGKGLSISFTSFDVLDEMISQNMLTIKQGEYIVSAYGYGITPEVPFIIITERELVDWTCPKPVDKKLSRVCL